MLQTQFINNIFYKKRQNTLSSFLHTDKLVIHQNSGRYWCADQP